jgi:site-specific recombinase XerD
MAQIHGQDWEKARNIAILYWLLDTGGRVSGLINATMQNLNLEEGLIETEEKGKLVTEFLNTPTLHALNVWLSYRANFDPQSDHIFLSYQTKSGMTRSALYGVLRVLAKEAGLGDERKNPQSFRHAFARDFLQNGGELTQLAGILHHTSIWVTATYYTRWNTKELKRAHTQNSPIKS